MNRLSATLSPIVLAAGSLCAQDSTSTGPLGPAMQVTLPGLEGVHRLGLAVADVDRDGRRDVVATVAGRLSTSVNRGADGFATFVPQTLTTTGFLPGT